MQLLLLEEILFTGRAKGSGFRVLSLLQGKFLLLTGRVKGLGCHYLDDGNPC